MVFGEPQCDSVRSVARIGLMRVHGSYTGPIPKWVSMIKTLTYWSDGHTVVVEQIHERVTKSRAGAAPA